VAHRLRPAADEPLDCRRIGDGERPLAVAVEKEAVAAQRPAVNVEAILQRQAGDAQGLDGGGDVGVELGDRERARLNARAEALRSV
jgi:hypothetical protein